MNPPAIHDDHASWRIESTARLPRRCKRLPETEGKHERAHENAHKTGPHMMATLR